MAIRFNSIAVPVTLTLVGITTLLTGGAGALGYRSMRVLLQDHLKHDHVNLVDQLAVALAPPVWNFDRDQIERILEGAMKVDNAERVALRLTDRNDQSFVRTHSYRRRSLEGSLGPSTIVEMRPIVAGGKIVGQLELSFTTQLMEEELITYRWGLIAAVAAIEVLMVVTLYLFLQKSEARFRAMFEDSTSASILLRRGAITLANPGFLQLVGSRAEAEWLGRSWRDLVSVADQPVLEAALDRAMRGEKTCDVLEVSGRRAGGEDFPLEIRLDGFGVAGPHKVLVNCRDLTEERRARRELQRVDRALRTVSQCNHVLIHATDEKTLFQDICRVIVEHNDYQLAWVGVAENDEAKTVRAVAIDGAAGAYVEKAQISWADVPHGHGSAGKSIRSGEPIVTRNILSHPTMAPWHDAARQHGVNSSLVFPLRIEGQIYGALSIYSADPEAFDAAEFSLLAGLASDMMFGLQSLRTRLNRDRAEADVRRLLEEAEKARLTLLSMLGDRQLAEEAQRRSEQLYRDAMQKSAIGMALVGLDGHWIEVNPALCHIVGYSREELLSRTFHSITHPDDRGPDAQGVRRLVDGEVDTLELEKRYLHKTGRSVWVRLNSSVVRDESDRPLHLVTQTQDITARKHAEVSLEAAAERLALALRVSKFGVWRYNLRTHTSDWDLRTFEIFGLPSSGQIPSLDQILGLVLDEDRARVRQAWNELPRCQHSYHMRFRVVRPDGKIRHIELQGSVRDDSLGRSEWSTGVVGDITAIVEASTESERLRARLLQSQKMETLGTLAAGVAHDFNNLLTGINGFVELASTSLGPGHEAVELLDHARRGAMSARDLVRRILNFSRSSNDQTRTLLNVVEVVRDTAPLIAAALPGNVSLSLAIECDAAPVLAEVSQLQQVLMNFCTNGAHAIGMNSGRIEIGVRWCELGSAEHPAIPRGCEAGPYIRLAVTDTGSGIDEATRQRLFEPFFTTKKAGEGTGLGLSIVQDIVASYEGGIDFSSTLGEGTTFAAYLPLARREGDPGQQARPNPHAPGIGQRILVVDDEPSIGAVVRHALQRGGFVPEVYSSPAAAWQKFESAADSFALLVIDQNMPEIGGSDFIRRAKRLAPALPTLMMSGRFENNSGASLPATTRIKKPFEIAELIAAVEAALHNSKADARGESDLP